MFKLLRKYKKNRDGATAIEFSMLFMPYLLISLGIIELSLMYLSASLVEGATDSAARLIKTGKIQQTNGDPQQMFRDALCDFATVLVDCEDFIIEVTTIDSYGDYSAATFDSNGDLIPQGFDPGASNDRVVIRVAYRYQMITPIVGPLLNGPGGSTLFMSTIVMQSEPYEFQGA
ncbi:MAG: TadE/TadG family type IV pilus assembly protein [Alcanivorax sp.]